MILLKVFLPKNRKQLLLNNKKNTQVSKDDPKVKGKTNQPSSTDTKLKVDNNSLPATGDTENMILAVLIGFNMLIVASIFLFRKPKTNQ